MFQSRFGLILALSFTIACGGERENRGAGSGGAGAGGETSAGGTASATGGTASTAGGTSGAGGSTSGAGGSTSDAPLLDQTGNPVYTRITNYTTWLSTTGDAAARLAADQLLADNMLTWQLPHGGFYKNEKSVYAAPWDGTAARSGWRGANSVELGTIDNNGTVIELLFLADVYQRSAEAKYRDAARKALDFLLTMQYPTGGFPQVYPARTGTLYSNHVTYNDDAMARVLVLLEQARKLVAPLDGDLFTDEQREKLAGAIAGGVQYILKSQITQAGVPSVWCAQHDPVSYEPMPARSYELASKSGKESASLVAFLMTQPQTAEIKASVQAALAWYRSSSVQVADTAYVKRPADNTDDTYNPIQPTPGSTLWYRFYDLDQDVGFFCGRQATDDPPGEGKQYDIMKIEAERRYGYEWGGSYGSRLLTYAASVGY